MSAHILDPPAEYAKRLRDTRLEQWLTRNLRELPPEERHVFLAELARFHDSAALDLARRVLTGKGHEDFLWTQLARADASSIKGWLELARDKLGGRRLLRLLETMCTECPRAVFDALYWLPKVLQIRSNDRRLATLRRRVARRAPRKGEHYTDEEIDEIVRVYKESPHARSRGVKEALAAQLGRTPGAIDMVMRWAAKAKFPETAQGRIHQQVGRSLRRYEERKAVEEA